MEEKKRRIKSSRVKANNRPIETKTNSKIRQLVLCVCKQFFFCVSVEWKTIEMNEKIKYK